jgi:hypothetical protein
MFGIDDAITGGMQAVGLGMQIYGSLGQADVSKEMAKVSRDQALHEKNINDLKAKQMEVEGRRSQLQTIRNTQRARALGIQSAVSQGADKGSGMLGGMFDVQNQGAFNLQGINFGLEIGRGINKENNFISENKYKMADLQGEAAEYQGWSSLGGALMKSGGIVGQFAKGGGQGLFPGVQLPGMD